jgi:exonuclease SbcD
MNDTTFTLIHTSDWHLGQHFMGKSRQAEHKQFLTWLIATALEQQAHAIIVAGDIFDTGSPPSYARELYNQFIVNLQPTGIHLIILGGNHDSTSTLGESKALLACLHTHVVQGALADINQQVIQLRSPEGVPQAIVCAIPYLRPRDLLLSIAGQTGSQKQQSLQQAISEHYHSIFAIAQQQQATIEEEYSTRVPIIATGHLTTLGAKSSESVRDIYIGTLDAFPSSAFPPADYIALGHIHRPQLVGGADHIRYCGSPIPLSFDELNKPKTIVLVEFNKDKFAQAQPIEVPCFQAMHHVKGDLTSIEAQINTLAERYQSEQCKSEQQHPEQNKQEQHPPKQTAWLDIEVQTQDFLNDLQLRIQTMLEGLPLEVLKIHRERKQGLHSIAPTAKQTLQELSPNDVFERRLALEDWDDDARKVKKVRITQAFNDVLHHLKDAAES